MVRFSDIIRVKGKKDREKKQPEATSHEEGFRLSDSELIKSRNVEYSVSNEALPGRVRNIETEKYYSAFVDKMNEIGHAVKNDMSISPALILSDLYAIIEKNLIDDLYEYAVSVKNGAFDISVHSVTVALTTLKLGKGMKYDIKMMMKLGLAAFLENVGTYKIPEKILTATDKLSVEENALIQKHPETSYEILLKLGERYKWLSDTALCIHERYDGSGYPAGLTGEEIPDMSAIIGLVDTYIAMINIRPYRDRFIQTDAIKYIIEEGREKFPPKIVKIFLDQISLFPVNSCVTLNNGFIGKVIATDMRHPLSPVIEMLYDGAGTKLDAGQQIDLADNPLLNIIKGVNTDDLEKKEAD